jgi:hypothetical protein
MMESYVIMKDWLEKKSLATGNSRSSGRTLIVKEGALMLEKLRPLTA